MSGGNGKVFPLQDNQLAAANPRDNVWLSASAGTGKTQVLSARVLRLLLRKDVKPSEILCLTFTKAGAAEMANRINAVLARWVRLDATKLGKELGHLGADTGPETQERARTLFASVLDCPGGGLRIDTIHAFSQWLLANFPGEAGLDPGARPIEDRERELLSRQVLGDMLVDAEATSDRKILDAVELITLRKDTDSFHRWLMHCAARQDLWHGADAWISPMNARIARMLGMPADADENWVRDALDPAVFPDDILRAILPLMQNWNGKTGQGSASLIEQWLTASTEARFELFERFYDTLLTKSGAPRQMKVPAREMPELPDLLEQIGQAVRLVQERRALLDLAELLVHSFELGRVFALKWDEAKKREGLLDFDDLIRLAAALLNNSASAQWIRYKLDRQFDHILIDEAQDTNEAQWDIVFALIDDFFDGEGASGDKLRTIFTVGDYKQAIFGFQGTSPENFDRAKKKVQRRIEAARENAEGFRSNRLIPRWKPLDLGQSFRTSKPVLEFVDRSIELLTPEAFGLDPAPLQHVGEDRPGLITLWDPVRGAGAEEESEDGEKDWLAPHEYELAKRIGEQVQHWVKGYEPFILAKNKPPRPAQAGDIMVLVRKRRDLARLIVGELHKRGVAVAGVDRLRLGDPLVVKDLLAALKFASQPLDDLTLANLLASPLMGWSQDDLLRHVPRPKSVRLWDHLRAHKDAFVRESADKLRELLRLADYETPQSLLAWLLIGPWQSRAKLVARLGREANDPIDELVNAAFAYEANHPPSLTGFIQWFEASDSDLKRDADSSTGQVRVMTVHGSKGLQAPIVILADAAGRPGQGGSLQIEENPLGEQAEESDTARKIPLPALSQSEQVGPVAEAAQAAAASEMEEHWRLLYVAMTRAEEALFIGGSLGPRDKAGPHADSWYARLKPLFEDADEFADDLWSVRYELGMRADATGKAAEPGASALVQLPDWATRPVGPEPKPPRPLAPSGAGEDHGADPPLPPEAMQAAARRGVIIHSLLERVPALAPEARRTVAEQWLERHASELDGAARREMLDAAFAVIENPDFADIFSPDALAEVPLAATVEGLVVSGTADRLLITPDRVTVVDFKTARRPPASFEQIPTSTVKQMAAYVAVLEKIYPDREVRAAVLYTQTPEIFELSAEIIELHKNRLSPEQESLAVQGIE